MSIRALHLVDCDRCHDSQFTPLNGRTPAEARSEAADNGWTRILAWHWLDICPACTAKPEPT